jgi:hypothetical protein
MKARKIPNRSLIITGVASEKLREMLAGPDVQSEGEAPKPNPIGDILASPMAKAVLAGIAAVAVKRVMGR